MATRKKAVSQRSFEEMLGRLDEIVKTLERGDSPLNQSLDLYTEGAELIRLCTQQLDEAEQVVIRLQKGPSGLPEEYPFNVGDS